MGGLGTRSFAVESKTTMLPSAETWPRCTEALAWPPPESLLSHVVAPVARSRRKTSFVVVVLPAAMSVEVDSKTTSSPSPLSSCVWLETLGATPPAAASPSDSVIVTRSVKRSAQAASGVRKKTSPSETTRGRAATSGSASAQRSSPGRRSTAPAGSLRKTRRIVSATSPSVLASAFPSAGSGSR